MIGGISIWQLLIILLIVALIFGTKKLRGVGSDLGGAVKGFKKALEEDKKDEKEVGEDVSADSTAEVESAENKNNS